MGFDGPDMDAFKQQTTVEWGRTVQNLTRALLKSKRRQRGPWRGRDDGKATSQADSAKGASARTADGKFSPVWNTQSQEGSTGGGDLVLSE
jgi:hypothetical protein